MFTDSHCHLSMPELMQELPRIRAAMQEARALRRARFASDDALLADLDQDD